MWCHASSTNLAISLADSKQKNIALYNIVKAEGSRGHSPRTNLVLSRCWSTSRGDELRWLGLLVFDAVLTAPWGGVPGTFHWREAPRKKPGHAPGWSGSLSRHGNASGSHCIRSSRRRMDGWMNGLMDGQRPRLHEGKKTHYFQKCYWGEKYVYTKLSAKIFLFKTETAETTANKAVALPGIV